MIDGTGARRLAWSCVLGSVACATTQRPEHTPEVPVSAAAPASSRVLPSASVSAAPATSAHQPEPWRAALPPVGSFACGEALCRASDEVCCGEPKAGCQPKGTACSPRAECDESADCAGGQRCLRDDTSIVCASADAGEEEVCVFGRPCAEGRRCVANDRCIPNRPPLPCGKETCTTAEAPYCLLDDGVLHCGGPGRPFYACFRDADCNAGEECCPANAGQVSACNPAGHCSPAFGFDQMCRTHRDCVSLGRLLRQKMICREGPTPSIRYCE